MRIGGAEVHGKYHLFVRWFIVLPQWYNHAGDSALLAGHCGFHKVERTVDVVICSLIEIGLCAHAAVGNYAIGAHAVAQEAQSARPVAKQAEKLHGVGVAMVGAHKGEYRCRYGLLRHYATRAATFVKSPCRIGYRHIGATQFYIFLLYGYSEAHRYASVAVFLYVEHITAYHALGHVGGIEILEECLGERQQVAALGVFAAIYQISVEEVLRIHLCPELYYGIRQEVGCSNEGILYGCIGQFSLCYGHSAGIHFGGAVPHFVDVAILLYLTVEIAAKHKWQFFALGLWSSGSYHKVALCHIHHYAGCAFFIELCSDYRHCLVAGERIECQFQALFHT